MYKHFADWCSDIDYVEFILESFKLAAKMNENI